jgi:hypothetical protein
MNEVVKQWLDANVCDADMGGEDRVITDMEIVTTERMKEYYNHHYHTIAKESIEEIEDYEAQGATHVVRFVMREEDMELVDGDDFYFYLDNGEFMLVSEPDVPGFCGGYVKDAIEWVHSVAK